MVNVQLLYTSQPALRQSKNCLKMKKGVVKNCYVEGHYFYKKNY